MSLILLLLGIALEAAGVFLALTKGSALSAVVLVLTFAAGVMTYNGAQKSKWRARFPLGKRFNKIHSFGWKLSWIALLVSWVAGWPAPMPLVVTGILVANEALYLAYKLYRWFRNY